MVATAQQHYVVKRGAIRACAVGFQGVLDTSELLTGTPTVTEVTTTALTITNKRVNTAAITILGVSHAIGEAVQFTVDFSSAVADTYYEVKIVAVSNATYAQTLPEVIGFTVIA